MLTGLRKRETYEELINELGDDSIKKYPDRRASQIEHSNFMSQLAPGLQEVIEQNDRIMKEKSKQLLLQEIASSSGVSHHGLKSMAGSVNSDFRSLGADDFISEAGDAGTNLQHFPIYTPRNEHQPLFDEAGFQRANDVMKKHIDIRQPLVDMNNNMRREYEQQLAIQNAELADERQKHQATSERLRG